MRRRFFAGSLIALPALAQSTIYFDEQAGERLRLGNSHYEIVLGKDHGGILHILDKGAQVRLTAAGSNGCLWGAAFNNPNAKKDEVGGCDFGAGRTGKFDYRWDASRATLSLRYSGGARVNAEVSLTPTEKPCFDLRITVDNLTDGSLSRVSLPADLLFSTAEVQGAYLAMALPGVRLLPEFFRRHRTWTSVYPGKNAAMDYLAADISGGRLALYTVNDSAAVQPALVRFEDESKVPDTFSAAHAFLIWTPHNSRFISPVVRVRIGQTVQETVLAYREENGIGAYPSIADKLGTRFGQVARAPMVKAHIDRPFREFTQLLEQVEGPAILHPVAFQAPGFDRAYPDFLPPDPRKGTTADFRAMVDAAHARNLLVMPYINPTWWCDDAPTWKNLPSPLRLDDIAVRDGNGKPHPEKYPAGGGWIPSPFVPFVRQRLDTLMAQWRDEVPVDFVFEDQIGSRRWLLDFNPAAPSPLSYSDGWLAHTARYRDQGLMTEDGWDRLAKTETGFCGSPLTRSKKFDPQVVRWGVESNGNLQLGAGTWEPYPLATWAFHDKVLFYHHDLFMLANARNLEVVTWNLAFGVNFTYICPGLGGATPPDRILRTNVLQRTLGPKYAGRVLTDYRKIAPDVIRSTFEGGLTVIANWSARDAYATGGHSIIPSGYLAGTADGSIVAGAFQDVFNRRKLTEGAHHIVLVRAADRISVWQPVGADTELGVDLPGGWKADQQIHVYAMDGGGRNIGEVPARVEKRMVVFEYRGRAGDAAVSHYEIPVTK